MKTTDLFQSILLFALFLCGLTACNDSDEIRLSPFQETTVKGEASTLQIDLTRGDWRITSITTPWGDLMMDGNKLPQLEGTGSLHYKWWDLERDTDSHLILHFKDNFDLGESRSLIINLEMKTGLYKEQIIIHQEPCTNFYQIESIESIDPEKRSIYLPNHIEDGKIIMGQQLLFFINQGKYYKEDELRYKHFEVDIVGMKWNIYTSTIYYKRLQVTFTATLSRPGSDTKKVLKGKFMQRYPYDCSEIHHEVKDSLED